MESSRIGRQIASEPLSRLFDVNRWSDYPELENCLSGLVAELEEMENRSRQRGADQRKKFRDAVRCLVLDLYVAWKTDPELLVSISLANSSYTAASRYRALFLYWSSFRAAYRALEQAGYIETVLRGFNDPKTGIGRTTRIRATDKLIQLLTNGAGLTLPRIASRTTDGEAIILRGAKTGSSAAPDLEYVDTPETADMRRKLQLTNEFLQHQWVDVKISDGDFILLNRRMYADSARGDRESPFIDLTQKRLVRIFNNGDWQQGGRFYRGWWQAIPKEYRRYIRINDKRTCEVDYSALHPTMMYAQGEQRMDGDAYDIGLSPSFRPLIKTTFNAMINASRSPKRPDDYPEDAIKLSWEQLQERIVQRHKPIEKLFWTGYGLRLQRLDSDLAQSVMLRFISMGYACLPVHDSFLVHHDLADELKEIMEEEFKAKTGQSISVKSILGRDTEVEAGYGSPLQSSLPDEDWFESVGAYAGYYQRLSDWNAHRGGLRAATA